MWRRAAGAGLLLAIAVGFAPMHLAGGGARAHRRDRLHRARVPQTPRVVRRLIAAVVILVVPLLVLVPWTWHVVTHPQLLLAGSGLPEFYVARHAPSGIALALLHAGGPAQPVIWMAIPILVVVLLGLTRRSRVAVARTGAALLVGGVAVAVAMTRNAGVTASLPASRHWPGVVLLVAGAGALMAVLVAATGARPALREHSFGWRQPAAIVLVVAAIVATAALAVGWVVRGAGDPLTSANPRVLPLFIQSELALKPTAPRALVLASAGPVISYAMVRRPGGPQLGDAETAPTSHDAGRRATSTLRSATWWPGVPARARSWCRSPLPTSSCPPAARRGCSPRLAAPAR